MLGELITNSLVLILGYAYPAFECFKTLEKHGVENGELRFWCLYWLDWATKCSSTYATFNAKMSLNSVIWRVNYWSVTSPTCHNNCPLASQYVPSRNPPACTALRHNKAEEDELAELTT
ncbi:TB2/DP1/HVA22-related protein [Artemisia annua]|uniref:TB2/DP1/HVA22-related protein n=1 Tax=Artemisia annua TaxID=35608 RepID=A0A2U1LBZ5_ARTAN|nr:TB2/DP1/HVA22-related protein [Artemisia annua]